MYIVYKRTNNINGKMYIGQTEQTLEGRWANGTGKTCLLTQLTKQRVNKNYISTYGADYYMKEYTTKQNKKFTLSLWDTNGSEKEVSILPSRLYSTASAFIIMCSYDNLQSYLDLAEWIEFFRNQRDKSNINNEFNNKRLTTIVVINKKDIKDKTFMNIKPIINMNNHSGLRFLLYFVIYASNL